VAIVGRPNVGKSTLFNRIIRKQEAIVDDWPGVTRDRKYARAEWEGKPFTLVDTGGFIQKSENAIEKGVTRQVLKAVEEADVVLFVTDCSTGVTAEDQDMAALLRKSKRPVLLIANKADNEKREASAGEFHRFGMKEVIPVSAVSGRGMGDLLSAIIRTLKAEEASAPEKADVEAVRLAVIGRPNTGKSTFFNTLIGEERVLVHESPGTTRDAVDIRFDHDGQAVILVDTAGMRKRSRISENVEYYSNLRTIRAVEQCDTACVFTDASEGITHQDMAVIQHVMDARKGLVIAVNKWDLVQKDRERKALFEESLIRLNGLEFVPVIRLSSRNGWHVPDVLKRALRISREREKRVPAPVLNRFMENLNRKQQPPSAGGKLVRIHFAAQVNVKPPTFAFFVNHPRLLKENYKRFLEAGLREAFGFQGVPLSLVFKQK